MLTVEQQASQPTELIVYLYDCKHNAIRCECFQSLLHWWVLGKIEFDRFQLEPRPYNPASLRALETHHLLYHVYLDTFALLGLKRVVYIAHETAIWRNRPIDDFTTDRKIRQILNRPKFKHVMFFTKTQGEAFVLWIQYFDRRSLCNATVY